MWCSFHSLVPKKTDFFSIANINVVINNHCRHGVNFITIKIFRITERKYIATEIRIRNINKLGRRTFIINCII